MIGVVVAAHGELADALVNTARLVVPKAAAVVAVGFMSKDDAARCAAQLAQAVETVRATGGVLVLTDMFGGTPSNVGLTLHRPGEVEVLTGANLPMLIKALQLCDKDIDLATVARQVKDSGARAIAIASEVLAVETVRTGTLVAGLGTGVGSGAGVGQGPGRTE